MYSSSSPYNIDLAGVLSIFNFITIVLEIKGKGIFKRLNKATSAWCQILNIFVHVAAHE